MFDGIEPRVCQRCEKPLSRKQKTYCSLACQRDAARPKTDSGLNDRIIELAMAGHTMRDISKQLGISLGSVVGRWSRHKGNLQHPKCLHPSPRHPRPIAIPLREVVRLAGELGVARRFCTDVQVVSRAMRRANPGHPGLVLFNLGNPDISRFPR